MNKYYDYNYITGKIIGESIIDIDPLETELQKKDIYTIPSNATDKEPLSEHGKYKNYFIDNDWILIPDYTRENYWYKETAKKVVFVLGDVPDVSMTEIEPVELKPVWNDEYGIWFDYANVERKLIEEAEVDILKNATASDDS